MQKSSQYLGFIEHLLGPGPIVRILHVSTHLIPNNPVRQTLLFPLSQMSPLRCRVKELGVGQKALVGIGTLASGSRVPLVTCRLISEAFPLLLTRDLKPPLTGFH